MAGEGGGWLRGMGRCFFSRPRRLGFVHGERAGAEKRERDLLDRFVLLREPPALEHRDLGGELHGIAVDAAADGGKSDRADPVRERELQAPPVTGSEELRLTARPAVPDGADGVDYVFRRQAIAAGDLRIARGAAP